MVEGSGSTAEDLTSSTFLTAWRRKHEVTLILGSQESPETGVTILAGTVTAHVGELLFTNPGRPPVRADISDGTFAVRLTGPPTATPQRPRDFTVEVNTPDGHVLYRGQAG